MLRKFGIIAVLSLLVTAFAAVPALAQVAPGVYGPDEGSFDSANAPAGTHLANRSPSPSCTVNADLSIDCNAYTLGGVGNTNADVSLVANYSAIVDCFNPGTNPNNPIESHETTFDDESTATVTPMRNGQLRVIARSVSPETGLSEQSCPNPNWEPVIREGTLALDNFTYTLTFAGFDDPYITISRP